ncbi:S1 family peptidase [Streptomyces sp. H10-C2]|uniref:S1 family peptidase n=1 Tax=unclassified Streptomyces TaxID=2593676 RepID=UPI0024BBA4FD|nr:MULTISPECIES: S1 family peptidase [unclassified Streptomyces]MDJ0346128.1 S1 family peptidase [Streptomyces sp. PH10-H1]MDJ0371610.1 S1 family peptidase [Streptomyces sp. H10-C2]
MNTLRIIRYRTALATAGAAVLTAAVMLPQAQAATPAPRTLTPAAASRLAGDLASRLGETGIAGSYYDAAGGKLVVNVLNTSAGERVRQAGAQPRIVQHSLAQLRGATHTLGAQARIPGTAWSIDPRTDQVVVTADRTVTGARLDRLVKTVKALGGAARLRRSTGRLTPFIAGGDAIWASGARCSLGFNVVKDGQPYFLTAGHCGVAYQSWSDSQGGSEIGSVESATFPGNDYALVRYTDGSIDHPSAVDLYDGTTQAISGASDATVGEPVQRSGSTTGVHGGTVTGLDATVNYPEGTINGLIDTDVCAEPGDSGGALFDGDQAIGLTSGGSGDCTNGGETFFQPVTAALSVYGASIG